MVRGKIANRCIGDEDSLQCCLLTQEGTVGSEYTSFHPIIQTRKVRHSEAKGLSQCDLQLCNTARNGTQIF